MPTTKFTPFPFARIVEVPVTRRERRWPRPRKHSRKVA